MPDRTQETSPPPPPPPPGPPEGRGFQPEELSPGRGLRLVGRALRLRCPACGRGLLFHGWTHMRRRCEACGLALERGEDDYFIGAYLLNLIIAELIVVALMLGVLFATWPAVPWRGMLWGIAVLTTPAVVATYPYSRSLWLAIDLWLRPAEPGDFAPEAEVIELEEARVRTGARRPGRNPPGSAPPRQTPPPRAPPAGG